jgi:ABC-type lipoprotein export system ATPase subunit
MSVVRISGLRKRYGDREAVRGIDLEIEPGEVFAFLGPNGAGKTTTVEILEGFRPASAGEVEVLGRDPWRARIGIVLQESEAEPGLTVRECMELYAGYYPAPREVDETLALVDLAEQSAQRATALSGGQRRRPDVALALIGDSELIFLDEPTTGFDPSARPAATTWKRPSGSPTASPSSPPGRSSPRARRRRSEAASCWEPRSPSRRPRPPAPRTSRPRSPRVWRPPPTCTCSRAGRCSTASSSRTSR